MQNIRQNRWLDRALEHSPDYVSFGLVILCGFLLARLTWSLFPAEPHLPGADPSLPVEQGSAAAQDIGEKIASYHLFGKHEPAKAAQPQPESLRNTQLALKLQGVYALPKNRGQAIIEESGQQKVYRVGETVGNSGAVLEDVFDTYITLRRNGTLEKLELPKSELSGGGPAGGGGFLDAAQENYQSEPPVMDNMAEMGMPEVPNMIAMESAPPVSMPAPDAMGAGNSPLAGAEPDEGGANNLADFRKAVLNNSSRLLEVASAQPYEENGKFIGFKLQPGSNVAMFNQVGLQPGDIATSVNGTVLDSPAAGMRALQGVANATQLTLGIIRGGQPTTVSVSF